MYTLSIYPNVHSARFVDPPDRCSVATYDCVLTLWLKLIDSKWFLKALGVQQFHKLLAGFEDKSAQAVCTFAYCEGPGCEPIVFQGRTNVTIPPNHTRS